MLLSVLVHLVLIAGFVSLIRVTASPVLFVDLAHGLDLAEEAVSDLRRAVADVGARVLPRASAPRAKSEGAPRPAASAPAPPAPAPAEPQRVDAPAPAPEPVRPAPEPLPPTASVPSAPVASVPAAPPRPAQESRAVEPPPSAPASAAVDSAVAGVSGERSGASVGGRETAGRAGAGSGGAGGSASVSDAGQPGAAVRSGTRDGAPLALAIPGTGGGDPAAADYAGYYQTLRQRLHESLTYPQIARRRGLTGTVMVDVEVDASGKVGRVTLINSSSHAVLDDAAIDALRSVGRVPFPPGVAPRRLRVRMPVVFEMR
jgi:TonB family protein